MLKIRVIKHSEAVNVVVSARAPLIYKLQEESSCQQSWRTHGSLVSIYIYFFSYNHVLDAGGAVRGMASNSTYCRDA